ncbi:dihydroneopterin triphosphate pyrophosphatase [Oryzisolibacter propanilivorax]|uniref:Dihydroneopterin triphosphate pyrophosphatase n=1 Tax=Oryzisolibacter propanilivorax TaxID=1527607 RepID=A0A1G9RCJ2_9BURK|nr:dihydroneopterin triphosphate diphosphatase [Oryzisolibacter propanilivorax]SDM20986.1 dihydroneopterin triphosphate pyrophosphatase [Oryzisolibacter propanilivorax]
MTAIVHYKIPRSVLVVIHTPGLQVLLLRRADTAQEFWQSVTGSKDHEDETWLQTAAREVGEETGIDASAPGCRLTDWGLENVYTIYPEWQHRYAPGVWHNTERVLGLCVPAGTPVALSPREHTAYAWWDWREAARRCYSPSNAEAILMLPRFADAAVP